ncbi:OLC1v1010148C1 [Oldenlandia corymbosa var. corymbosa]|uniref:OLC1v1010148C1 n=1 Tax=Oldenlandia corymbosa var. corymbosa TaxID=529605 RepID=A0AAV1DQX4_OLDCO|nr:OLC1v1010148C1 [Oldenlandia corymbosa var. corymbosa]
MSELSESTDFQQLPESEFPENLTLPPPLPKSEAMLAANSLFKQKSWSPDTYREEAWQRRRGIERRKRRSKSVTDEDVEELKACIELGFGFDSPEMDKRLSDTFPAYGLYYAVNKHYTDTVLRPSASGVASPLSSAVSDSGTPSPLGSPLTIFGPGENPQTVKTKLRQWAQVVACTVRQSSTRT